MSNDEVLNKTGRKRTLIHIIKKQHLSFHRQIMKEEELETLALASRSEAKRDKGKHRVDILMSLCKCVGDQGLGWGTKFWKLHEP